MAQDPLAGKTGPNILITGTPGVGKSSFCDILTEELSELNISMKVIDVNQIIKNNKLYEEEDAQRKCLIVDEEKLVNYCEKNLNVGKGGLIIDTHLCGALPSNWFDLVVVLRCDNTQLYDRLKDRGYDKKKIQENVQAEIFQTIYDEAIETYGKNKVKQLTNSTVEEQEKNVSVTQKWIQQYVKCLQAS